MYCLPLQFAWFRILRLMGLVDEDGNKLEISPGDWASGSGSETETETSKDPCTRPVTLAKRPGAVIPPGGASQKVALLPRGAPRTPSLTVCAH
jgi:hypothetical protein